MYPLFKCRTHLFFFCTDLCVRQIQYLSLLKYIAVRGGIQCWWGQRNLQCYHFSMHIEIDTWNMYFQSHHCDSINFRNVWKLLVITIFMERSKEENSDENMKLDSFLFYSFEILPLNGWVDGRSVCSVSFNRSFKGLPLGGKINAMFKKKEPENLTWKNKFKLHDPFEI